MNGNFSTITCAFCGHGDVQMLGPLLGPIRDIKTEDIYHVHHMCALWSPEVWENDQGSLQNVTKEIRRGRTVRCHRCNARGATVGCRVSHCRQTYHFHCAKLEGCTLYPISYQLACPAHARWFVKDEKQQRKELERKVGLLLLSPPPPRPHPNNDINNGGASLPLAPQQHPQELTVVGSDLVPSNAPYLSPHNGATTNNNNNNNNNNSNNGQPTTTTIAVHGSLCPNYYYEGPSPHYFNGNTDAAKRRRKTASGVDPTRRVAAANAAMRNLGRQIRMKRIVVNSDDDEEFFAKKEAKRLARDTARLNPVTLAQHTQHDDEEQGCVHQLPPPPLPSDHYHHHHHQHQQQQQQQQLSITPTSITNCDFNSIAGADHVVSQLREMVLLPLLYPDLFQSLGISPPKGILFHGPPGTGKTLAARALAGACTKSSPVPVALFARKGADCLGKFHGEAERTLRLLFEEAKRRAPAIIFLDEIDALAPCRSSRSGGGDQIHASVVSTLLALMDGATDRGGVVVVGATNRPEAIDPALRRPGRFDREVFFPLPGPGQRVEILRALTKKWPESPSEGVLEVMGGGAEGYAGADLQALCSSAVMAAVRRSAPRLLEQLIDDNDDSTTKDNISTANTAKNKRDYLHSMLQGLQVTDDDWKSAMASAPVPSSRREGLAAVAAASIKPIPRHIWPLVACPFVDMLKFVHSTGLPLPAALNKAAKEAMAAVAAIGGSGWETGLVRMLEELGAVEKIAPPFILDEDENNNKNSSSSSSDLVLSDTPHQQEDATTSTTTNYDNNSNNVILNRNFPPSRLLLAGNDELGQESASGAMLKLLEGCQIHTLSLPALLVQGHGDPTAGCAALVGEALRRAEKNMPTVLYLPRIETWAMVSTGGGGRGGGGGYIVQGSSEDDEEADSGIVEEKTPADNDGGNKMKTRRRRRRGNGTAAAGITSPPVQLDNTNGGGGGGGGGGGFKIAPSPLRGLLNLQDRVGTSPTFATTVLSPPLPPPPPSQHRLQQQQLQEEADKKQQEEEEEEEGAMVDKIQPSEPWLVLEALLRQSSTEIPVLIVATCHLGSENLPDCMVSFFSSSSSGDSNKGTTAGNGIVNFAIESEVEERTQWGEAMKAAAAFVTGQLSLKSASLVYNILGAAAAAAAAAAATGEDVAATGEDVAATGEGMEGDRTDSNIDNDEADDTGADKRMKRLQQEEEDAAVKKTNQDLENQLFLGTWLLSQCYNFIKTLGGRLLKDQRCEEATVMRRNKEYSFLDLAEDSYRGKYTTLDGFQQAVQKLVLNIVAAEGVELGTLEPAVEGVNPAVHAACSLQDDIDAKCLILREALDLVCNEGNRRAMMVAHKKADAEMKKMREQEEEEEEEQQQEEAVVALVGDEDGPDNNNGVLLIIDEEQPSLAAVPSSNINNNGQEPSPEVRAAVEVATQLGVLLKPELEKIAPKKPLQGYSSVQSAEEIVNAMLLHANAVLNEEFEKNRDVFVEDEGREGALVSLCGRIKSSILANMGTILEL